MNTENDDRHHRLSLIDSVSNGLFDEDMTACLKRHLCISRVGVGPGVDRDGIGLQGFQGWGNGSEIRHMQVLYTSHYWK
jgi:hypothetical protein